MKRLFINAQLRLLMYVVILAMCGVVAMQIGPSHGSALKALIGIVAGCALTHRGLRAAYDEAFTTFYALFFDDEED